MKPAKKVLAAALAAAALAVGVLAASGSEGTDLTSVWQELVGQRGVLEDKDCRYVLTLSTPTQSGNAAIKAVGGDHVVLLVSRDQDTFEYVLPLNLIALRRQAGR